ncbi:hypothetical protein ARAM_004864 [Aspergillus rambellii]|uniref:CENP-S associating centromere protein X-domain-containing protein n=1 Tax=Aspergillus rambellii TaxID=308745 RepID=A0A0F8TXP0_9EURO|nr:hypothetical protein ARAM_004864 [Aspergillus rambellii]
MPPERQPAQKRRRLPFNPPSRASTTTPAATGPSTTTTTKPKPKSKSNKDPKTSTTIKKKTSKTNRIASSSKPAPRASASSHRKSPTPVSESATTESGPDSQPPSDSGPRSRSRSRSGSRAPSSPSEGEPDYILAEITHTDQTEDVVSSEPLIPRKLLTRLLHHHFRNEKTKIAKDANAAVAKYIDVYVREAVARAAYERAQGGTGAPGVGDGFLEVEDLEKMGPQLAMDF